MTNLISIILLSFVILSCSNPYEDNKSVSIPVGCPIDTYNSLYKIKTKDAIYTRICGDFMKVIVLENDTTAKMITYKRPNYFDANKSNYNLVEVKSYEEIIEDSK